jgi:hypothetical protein
MAWIDIRDHADDLPPWRENTKELIGSGELVFATLADIKVPGPHALTERTRVHLETIDESIRPVRARRVSVADDERD